MKRALLIAVLSLSFAAPISTLGGCMVHERDGSVDRVTVVGVSLRSERRCHRKYYWNGHRCVRRAHHHWHHGHHHHHGYHHRP